MNFFARWTPRLLAAGILLLPLVSLPGLERPFSSPKLWLIAALDLVLCVHVRLRAVEWPWLLWPAAMGASALLAPQVSLEALLLAALPLPFAAAAWDKRFLLAGSTTLAAVALMQYCGADPFGWFGWHPEYFSSSRMRVYGTLGNPDFVAAFLCATLPLFLGVRRTWWWGAAGAIQLAAVFATGSRVFLIALAVSAIALVCRVPDWRWLLAGIPVAAAILWLSPARPLAKTIEGRWQYVRVVAGHIREIPPAGFGPGSFEQKYREWSGANLDHAHNDYVETLVEYGPLGCVALLGLLGWVLATSGGADRTVWAAAATLMAIACVDFPFHRPAEWALLWCLVGTLRPALAQKER